MERRNEKSHDAADAVCSFMSILPSLTQSSSLGTRVYIDDWFGMFNTYYCNWGGEYGDVERG